MRFFCLLLIISACVLTAPSIGLADDFILAEKGAAKAVIFAPGENQWAGKRLSDRIERWTGAKLEVITAAKVPAGKMLLIAIGSPKSNPVVKDVLGKNGSASLGDEGFILKSAKWHKRPVVIAAGNTLAGANNAVSELLSWKLKLSEGSAYVASDLNESDKPALQYRILWDWDISVIWEDSFQKQIERQSKLTVAPWTQQADSSEVFAANLKRAIDFYSDHKLNGVLIWGFLRDSRGGVELGRELSLYAKQNNVRILPGVCTEAYYGGFIYSDTNTFNVNVWTKLHPELRAKNAKGEFVDAICPSRPENQQWLRDGARWIVKSLPDIGGVNLENGDFMDCRCSDCVAAKAKLADGAISPYLFDQAVTYKPVLEELAKLAPDYWSTFATYFAFVHRPWYLTELPPNGIAQWTITGMVTPDTWPLDATLPKAAFNRHVGFIHQGSMYAPPIDTQRWWAAPNGMTDEVSETIAFVCSRLKHVGMNGFTFEGEIGALNPTNELNYIAMEYFTWHPEKSYEQFKKERLALCYGGIERADLFLKLLRNTTKSPAELENDRLASEKAGQAKELDVRQKACWKNLYDELTRRKKLADPSIK